jgi:hypothetical protein
MFQWNDSKKIATATMAPKRTSRLGFLWFGKSMNAKKSFQDGIAQLGSYIVFRVIYL